ncbi:Charged multivesicular body protein 5 [Globisporangium polare]
MTKENARRSSCGPGISSSSSSSSSGGCSANRSPGDSWTRADVRGEFCDLRAGNQEDASFGVADAKSTMAEATPKSVESESGGGEHDDGARGEGLASDAALLEDAEQQPQQENDAPTALEALLDLELDVYTLPALEDNQFALQEQQGDDFGALSLELLALQSPHGKRQQWDERDGPAVAQAQPHKLRLPEEPSPHSRCKQSNASAGIPDLTSPSQHVAPFQPSPCHSADGDEYDLASPVGLPDTPNTSSQTSMSISRWESVPDMRYEADGYFESMSPPPQIRTPSRSVAKKTQRSPFARTPRISPTGSSTARSTAATTASSHQPQQHQQPPPASVPKRKVKHGGIYSLLLKNRGAGDHEAVLVDDEKRSPEVPEDSPGRARSAASSKKSPPPSTFGKAQQQQHGSIYRMLRSSKHSSGGLASAATVSIVTGIFRANYVEGLSGTEGVEREADDDPVARA